MLWDTRISSERGPALTARLPRGERASSIHIDDGIESSSGHLLLQARRGGAVHLFDIRRVCGSGDGGGRLKSLATAAREGGATCFAAHSARLVAGGGPKSVGASMWSLGAATAGSPALEEAEGAGGTQKARQKKARGTKKQWSH